MPDWSYQTVLRPLLFTLKPESSRDVTLTAMGTLASLPLGTKIIDLMGHMHPPAEMQRSALGIQFPGPVGLSAGLDVHGKALKALAEFGFGFIEVGSVTLEPVQATGTITRRIDEQVIIYPDLPVNRGCDVVAKQLAAHRVRHIPTGVRLGYRPGTNFAEAAKERRELIRRLHPLVDFFTLDYQIEQSSWTLSEWCDHLAIVRETLDTVAPSHLLMICIHADSIEQQVRQFVSAALDYGVTGIVISEGVSVKGGKLLVGLPMRQRALQMIRFLRREYGKRITIIGAGGIHEPGDALKFFDAGTDLIQIHSGLVYSGPGLPKRINEALAYYRPVNPAAVSQPQPRALGVPAWVWTALLGLGLIVSGIVVWIVAVTRTVLPYDETFVGMTRDALLAVNDRLLDFMAHDRVTVAGTMVATGFLYTGLAIGGMRRGMTWAKHAVFVSAAAGFLSFFLFLGFKYFDIVHAILTVGLLPLFILGMLPRFTKAVSNIPPNLTNDWRWRSAQWGQLMFVLISIGLILAGFAISGVGITTVLVPEDLEFMQTSYEYLNSVNPNLIPLIAHDRAGFGGNLVSIGLGLLLVSLWGFRQGHRWLWWTLLLSGVTGFIASIGIHLEVGYVNLWHLFPAILAVLLFVFGLAFSLPYLYQISRSIQDGVHR